MSSVHSRLRKGVRVSLAVEAVLHRLVGKKVLEARFNSVSFVADEEQEEIIYFFEKESKTEVSVCSSVVSTAAIKT